jgi:hypothetical protein
MTARPTSVTIFALYLMIVFGLSIIGSSVGALRGLQPYTSSEWLLTVVPKVLALMAGFALWRMLRIGAWLWFASVAIGWALAVSMRTFFPNFTIASIVSLVIVAISIWILATNWNLLRPLRAEAAK